MQMSITSLPAKPFPGPISLHERRRLIVWFACSWLTVLYGFLLVPTLVVLVNRVYLVAVLGLIMVCAITIGTRGAIRLRGWVDPTPYSTWPFEREIGDLRDGAQWAITRTMSIVAVPYAVAATISCVVSRSAFLFFDIWVFVSMMFWIPVLVVAWNAVERAPSENPWQSSTSIDAEPLAAPTLHRGRSLCDGPWRVPLL